MTETRRSLSVLFVIDSLGGGGAERSTAVVLPYLRELGVEARVVTLYRSRHGVDEDQVRSQGFSVTVLEGQSSVERLRELRAILKSAKPDIVHTALFNADMLGRIASAGLRPRVISSLVSTPYDPQRRRDPNINRYKLMAVRLLDAATARVFVDHFQAVSLGAAKANQSALRFPRDRITVVERGRDPVELGRHSGARRSSARDSLGVAQETPVVLAVGRSDHQKAHDDLVDAFAIVKASLPDALLLIAGRPGNADAQLEQALERHRDVAASVHRLGHRNDVPDLLVAADVLAIASRVEGTAGVALEAMALGVPVVATSTTGVEGILRHGENSMLSPVGAPGALAAHLRDVLEDADLARSIASTAHHEFCQRFTVEASAKRLFALYCDVAAD